MSAAAPHKLELHGEDAIPAEGVRIVPNHLAFADLLRMEKLLAGRKITYLIERRLQYDPLLQAHLEKNDVEALEFALDESLMEAFKKELHTHIAAGEVVIFVPGEALTKLGQNISVPSEILAFLMDSGAPVLPVYVDHPEDTCLKIETIHETERIVLSFGKVLKREAANVSNFLEEMLVAGEVAFSGRPILATSLAFALLKGLKKHGNHASVIDGIDKSDTSYAKVLAAAIVLSKYLKKQTEKKRIGILLPPGRGGLVANLAVLFAGKIPVNLNFTAGDHAVASCIKQADLDKFITADPFVRKMSRFSWPPNKQLILLDRVLPPMKKKIALWLGISKVLPVSMLASVLGIPKKGDREEAVLLFTSGSSGDPKGVVLSHRNLLANVNQFGARIDLRSTDKVLGCLPLFHSFGCTVTLWYPVIEGVTLVTYPSPMETPKLTELIEKYRISLVITTPTFLRGYLRKAKKEQLASIKLLVTGAEKLPEKVATAFEKKFDLPVLEGYGLTETSPVSNANLPDPEPEEPGDKRPVIPNHRRGSVGQLIPGMAVRITDPNTDEPLPLRESGMIWLRGSNIFEGYLNLEEKTAEMLQHGWLRTGDIGRVDDDGFLYIEGRLSRFSKIGGEMVPHETVEAAINDALGVDAGGDRVITVVGVPDDAKGEALVLLSSMDGIDATDLRYRLLDKGLPSLWIPKTIIEVDEIPVLASGKLDIRGCEVMARKS